MAPGAPVLLVVCLIAYAGAARIPFRPASPVFIDENALSPVAKYGGGYQVRDWARIKHSAPRLSRVLVGGHLELECEANGSPPPSVQWLHNGNPVTQGLDENNMIGGLRLGNVRSRLVIDCATPRHHGTYSCVATAGTESVASPPSLVIVQGVNGSSSAPVCADRLTAPPRIVTYSSHVMETMGNEVRLPCEVVGQPSPQVYWVDSQDNVITAGGYQLQAMSDDRFKVLETGELVISGVRWSDMGHYTCVAENPLGIDRASTFLYPMSSDR